MPPGLVVTKGLNSWAAISSEMPGPVSETSTTTWPSPSGAGPHHKLAAIAVTHRLHCIAHQVGQDLLDLDTVHHDQICSRAEIEDGPDAALTGPDERQGAGFFDQLADVLRRLFCFALCHEFAQVLDDLPCPKGLRAVSSSASRILAASASSMSRKRRLQPWT